MKKLLGVFVILGFLTYPLHSSPQIAHAATSECLTRPTGTLTTLTGSLDGYYHKTMPQYTRIDASAAKFLFTNTSNVTGSTYPVTVGAPDLCWYGGFVDGGYPLDTPWSITHSTGAFRLYDGSDRAVIDGIHTTRFGDGITIRLGEYSGQAGIQNPVYIKNVWLEDQRDDCVESDWQASVNITDSLLDGCYAVFAAQRRSDATTDGSNNTWEIRNTLAYMHDQIGVYNGTSPGHSEFFKWDDTGPKIKIYDSIFRVDSSISETNNQFNFRPDKLVDCSNNIMVWLGPGEFPAPLPSCFTVTKDKAVWDNAVTNWKNNHGYGTSPATTVSPSPTSLQKPGDANGDGTVNAVDYTDYWLPNYLKNVTGAGNGDFNSDSKVDGVDYVIWYTNYGT